LLPNYVMKKLVLFSLLFVFLQETNAQSPGKNKDPKSFQFGIKVGASFSKITDLSKVLVNEAYYSGYTFTNKNTWGFTGCVFLNYKFEETISAIYSEISYSRLGNVLQYADELDLKYDFTINYDFVNWELWYKAYVYRNLHFGVGFRLGFNLTPGNLYYTSNGEALYGPDIRIQQQMRDVLKGRTDFSMGIGLGFELNNGITFDARYYYGLRDVIETEVNNFNFIENKNLGRSVQFTIGYIIPDFKFF